MKERGILMSAPMVLATLDGRKTVTRRIVKPQPEIASPDYMTVSYHGNSYGGPHDYMLKVLADYGCPYGRKGDSLYVRETWQYSDWTEDGIPYIRYEADSEVLLRHQPEEWADRVEDEWAKLSANDNYEIDGRAADRKWRPAIHMPRWAARIWLEITDVRVECVQDISDADAVREGVGIIAHDHPAMSPRELFQHLFMDTYPNAWTLNSWVWVIEFRRIEQERAAA